ncbi:response regulator transcription factor [Sphingobacterium sp. BIGb0165]|uniref:response regulator transcription factor n=1 Tax=Sphingobacterium sp. BIGb0165 TaxID=2940615 RepID=UPI00216A1ADA|nr:response regulator transcription factor [Sphingobacterium sp. BIGb0165]MCS4228007.1 DNA-binding response OmpR family regulator [Sphingobacterium sp. BIGb0165]
MKVLVIEDETELRETLKDSLIKEDYMVETASDFRSALDKVSVYDYDCILLDIMLPGGSGLQVLDLLKKEGKSDNVIIISAKDSLDDKLKGLELGADDYLTKPFHIAELNARIKAVLRRKRRDGKNTLEMGNLVLDLNERSLSINGESVPLNRKEFDILNYFLLNKNRLVSKNALAEHVWGDNTDQADNLDFIYSQIKNLRKKFLTKKAEVDFEAVYGIGYKLVEK